MPSHCICNYVQNVIITNITLLQQKVAEEINLSSSLIKGAELFDWQKKVILGCSTSGYGHDKCFSRY